jgi:ribosomal protein S3
MSKKKPLTLIALRYFKNNARHITFKNRKAINVRGFFFDIRGKVGVTGNAKKRHFFFKEGKSSFTEKRLKLSYYQDLVRTKTGVLGVTLAISQ